MPIHARRAEPREVDGICRVCADAYRATYPGLLPENSIEHVISEFYNAERVRSELLEPEGWDGWWVADEDGVVVGAGGGAITARGVSEVYVLYVDPSRRGEGIGTLLLDAITPELIELGAREQWVSVQKGNEMGVPFYEARGFVAKGERPSFGGVKSTSLRLRRLLTTSSRQ